LNKQQLVLGRRVHETADEIVRHQRRLAEDEASYSENRHRCATQDEQLQTTTRDLAVRREQLELDRTRRLELTKMVSAGANAVTTLKSQIGTIQAFLAKVGSQLDQLDGDIAGQELEREKCLRRVDEAVLVQTLSLIHI
jgi:septal ring factor EnvC (AmiA/AmiB activator)